MDFALVFQHSLLYGAILSVLLSALIIVSAGINTEIWINDYPPDIREKYGPVSEKTKAQRKPVSVLFLLALVGTIALSVIQLQQTIGGEPSFLTVLVSTFIVLTIFNLVDLLILDWLLFATLQPRRFILPGTEGMEGYRDYGFHFRGFLIGLGFSLVGSLVVAGIAALIYAIF